MSNNYIRPDELRRVADILDSLVPLWEYSTNSTFDVTVECDTLDMNVYDSNGDIIGYIRWSEDGPAFYPVSA